MNTTIGLIDNEKNIERASSILNAGGLVAFPTETVYGLGGDGLNTLAASKIYSAKGRPSDNPLIIHIANIDSCYLLAKNISEPARALMEAFWPGPLTIVLQKRGIVPPETTGGLETVALRMPSHPGALELIRRSGIYIAAPSANLSGRPSPTTAQHVLEDMNGRIDMILDGGPVGIGIESTIIDMTSELPTILRPGFITKSMLEDIIGPVEIDIALLSSNELIKPKAPGMKYTHYAPKGELTIVDGFDNSFVINKINQLVKAKQEQGQKVAILTTGQNSSFYLCDNIIKLGNDTKGETIAAKLYSGLRLCDELEIDFIYSEAFNEGELGNAIMNRLVKAAGHRVLNV